MVHPWLCAASRVRRTVGLTVGLAWLGLAAAAGGGPATATLADGAVVQVNGAEMCSGVYVAPYALVTAAHCVVAPSGATAPVSLGVRYSSSATVPACWRAAKEMSCDWAVVRFAGPPAPLVHRLSSEAVPVGAGLRLVGFPWNGWGSQRTLTGSVYARLDAYPDELFYTDQGIQGFSGGPLLDGDDVVRGVHGYLVAPWIVPEQTGAGAAVIPELRADVAAVPVGTRRLLQVVSAGR